MWILTRVELPDIEQNTADATNMRLHEAAQTLEQSVKEGWEMISRSNVEVDLGMEIDPILTLPNIDEDGGVGLLRGLQYNIRDLSQFTFQIKAAFALIEHEVNPHCCIFKSNPLLTMYRKWGKLLRIRNALEERTWKEGGPKCEE